MHHPLTDTAALAVLMIWPAIPLFWIPVHCAPRFFRRLGFLTYVLPFVTWLPTAAAIYSMRNALLIYHATFPVVINIAGIIILAMGTALQIWTLVLLTLPGIMGMPEVSRSVPGNLVENGPFSIIRHPTYLAHTMMLFGAFLWTEAAALAIITVIDAVVVNIIVIPLEEKELRERFGKEYDDYCKRVPSRFLPLKRPE